MSREKLIKTLSISAKDPTGKMMRHQFYRRAVGPYDVHIKIRYAGVCHSDIHTAKGEWGPKKYPICVGHEIIGDVVCIGEKVTKFKVGDTAGVGCFTDSCRACDECKEGVENYCSGPGGMHGTYGSKRPESLHPGGMTMGGYSSDIVVDENYTIRIPKKMNVAAAAPLLCAGITCYAPFRDQGITKGHHLGVVGLGGLGHMAVKIGKALGCIITVFTRTKSKKELALKMGASKVVISTNKEEMIAARKSLHFIYNSIAFNHDIHPYLNCLKAVFYQYLNSFQNIFIITIY